MRRLLLALASTAAGLAAILSFKTHSSAVTSNVAAPATGAQSGTTSGTPAGTGTGASTAGASTAGTGSATAGPKGGTGGAAAGTQTLTGAVENTPYGPMQVEVILQGHKITDVKVLQRTNTGIMSQQIDANSIPQLTRETLTVQSARIDTVSGATSTSAGYIQSLQSALDKA